MKKLRTLAATLLTASALSTFVPTASAQEKVQVTFWHAMNGKHQETITKLVEEFNNSQDTVEVIEQNQGDYSSLQQSVMASGVSGQLPTIAQLTASNTPDYMDQGLLMPLNDILTAENGFTDELREGIFPGFMTGVTFGDKIYALPFAKSVRLMFVNQTMLNEVGAEVPKTWEEVKALGEALDKAGIEKPAMGFENDVAAEYETMARQNGAAWISSDLSKVDFTSKEALEPIQFIKELIDAGHARTAGEDGYMSGPFSSGESALYIGSSAGLPYVLPGVEENNIELKTAHVPVFGGGEELTIFAGNDLGVFSSASEEQQKGAIQFISFLLNNTARWASETGYLPVTKQGVESEVWTKYLEENPLVKAASEELEFGMSQPAYVGASEVYSELKIALENILINGSDFAEEMGKIESLVKGHLGQ
ncbi:ABC transporter substrate-binding protein [Aerococcaceae bacterium zg-ZUI334]|uniref:ABC transporter substrate-binding protein n=1 Tax=Aerococcaceae TaxID=186827 RepID=UPI0013B9ACAF|nr:MULTISPECIES: ABC transporter substrate-binding protein [unclassified Facklamia]MBR7926733.1 ABC transporter substrate-binding protein [Aerococcaceae bacterium zg-ZUI334]MBS4461684.1 ABC transporter substrate-binding protein [Aerococcaceae bacterium zg-B36]QQD65318.1 ABC transporter substrate-binding protein [Aerococcaceae bacterium zg-252]NEW63973.1 extracellular solute-binding protein [Facklamia sp. 252]NEW67444.1 extracellular solute-binding protein [Facklamia sp. 253]